jgi:hypothetical protein
MKISLAGETLAISAAQGNHGVGRTLTVKIMMMHKKKEEAIDDPGDHSKDPQTGHAQAEESLSPVDATQLNVSFPSVLASSKPEATPATGSDLVATMQPIVLYNLFGGQFLVTKEGLENLLRSQVEYKATAADSFSVSFGNASASFQIPRGHEYSHYNLNSDGFVYAISDSEKSEGAKLVARLVYTPSGKMAFVPPELYATSNILLDIFITKVEGRNLNMIGTRGTSPEAVIGVCNTESTRDKPLIKRSGWFSGVRSLEYEPYERKEFYRLSSSGQLTLETDVFHLLEDRYGPSGGDTEPRKLIQRREQFPIVWNLRDGGGSSPIYVKEEIV